MFDKFSDRARKVMSLARQEAERFKHDYIGTEHILLGLAREGAGTAVIVLENLDVNLQHICKEVEKLVKPGAEDLTTGQLLFTPGCKKVLEFAVDEARALNHDYVGTEHLLLGLIGVQTGLAAQVLKNMHLKYEDVREEVLEFLRADEGAANAPLSLQPKPRCFQCLSLLHEEEATCPLCGWPRALNEISKPYGLTKSACNVLSFANQEAARLHHDYIGTEHVLLGFMLENRGIAGQVLKALGLDLERLRAEFEKLVKPGPEATTSELRALTPRAKSMVEYAIEEAGTLNQEQVNTEHLLLGLLREEENLAAQILLSLDLELTAVRQTVLNALNNQFNPASPSAPQEFLCFECKAIIQANETACSKCGWTWNK